MGRLDGRVAIVTGAAQGIGAHYARTMAAEGAKLVVTDMLDPTDTVTAIADAGGEAIGLVSDVTDEASVADMVEKSINAFGRIDILVANAALFGVLKRQKFEDIPTEEWDRVMQVNVRGVWQCVKAVVPQMRKQGYGKIVTISSGTVFKGTTNLLHYVSSKGAIVAFTRAVAREVGDDNICINAIAPGLTESEMVLASAHYETGAKKANVAQRTIKRGQVPGDLTGAVIFLSSAESDFMTGQTMVIDGGSAMH